MVTRISCILRRSGTVAILALVLLAGACAFVDESITLSPTSALPSADVGHGQKVSVAVSDERPSLVIGRRGPQRAAEIRPVQDVASVVVQAVEQGLQRQGFQPVDSSSDEPVTLRVQVRDLSYDTSYGFWTGGVHTRASLKAVAHNRGRNFEQLYRAEKEERVIIVPTEASDVAAINEVLSQVIDQMLADQRLLDFLAAVPSGQ